MTKAALDDFKPGRGLPSCVLEARPLSEDLPQLVHQIILKGIKPPDHKTLLSYLPPKINQGTLSLSLSLSLCLSLSLSVSLSLDHYNNKGCTACANNIVQCHVLAV